MKDLGADTGDLLVKLELAAYARTLPERARLASRQLHRRLSSPIRVAILGHPQSGKTELLNLIAGERILPPGNRLPTIELSYGEDHRAYVTAADGAEYEIAFDEIGSVDRADAGLLRIEVPLRILAQVTLTEVVSEGTAEEERAAVQWAAESADLALWCSQDFSMAEQWLWSTVPERLKDHGFLVLTKADELIRDGVLHDRIGELGDIVAEQFHSLIPVATLQGVESQNGAGGRDEAAFRGSGARALIDALIDHIEQGRRADMDAAMLLISRFAAQLEDADREDDAPRRTPSRPLVPIGQDAPVAPVSAPVAPEAPPPFTDADPEEPAAPVDDTTAEIVELHPEQRPTEDAAAAAAPEASGDEPRWIALDLLNREARALAELDDHDAILGRCAEIAAEVAEMLSAQPSADPVALRVAETAHEVSEMVVLMQLEQTEAAAADAVTLLLQLSRDLDVRAAA